MNEVYEGDHKAKLDRFYFYMMKGERELIEYFVEELGHIDWKDVPGAITTIATWINEKKIEPNPNSRQYDRWWKKKNYYVLYLESADERLQVEGEGGAAIFDFSDGGGNHAFRDGSDIAYANGVSAFYCVNHLKRARPKHQQVNETFDVDIFHYDRRNAGAGPRNHSDTGTNTGPP